MSAQDFIDETLRELTATQDQVATRAGRLHDDGWDAAPAEVAVEALVAHDHFTSNPGELDFSPREVVCHLLDSTQNEIKRISRLRTDEGQPLGEDEATRAERFEEYRTADEETLLQNLEQAQEELRRAISSVQPDEIEHAGLTQDGDEISLREILVFLREHEEAHGKQLGALTAESMA